MKTSKLLFLAAISAAFASCSNDDLVSTNSANNTGLKGKLVETGLIGMGRDAGNAETRAYSVDGQFIWMPTLLDANGMMAPTRTNQRIGLAWTGLDNKNPEFSAATALSQKVYTNYEFEHIGWLDADATGPEFEECAPFGLINGAFINGEATPVADHAGTYNAQASIYQYAGGTAVGYPQGRYFSSVSSATANLNLGTGLFKTNNASVFEGEYLVYFPYTDKFTKGQILADQPWEYDIDVAKNRFTTLSEHAFAIGYIPHYNGGSEISKISTKTLSAFAGVKLYNYNSAQPADKNIKKVVLYSPTSGIIYQQDLDAAKCVDALKNGGAIGKDLYFESANKQTTNAVFASLTNSIAGTDYATITGTTSKPAAGMNVYFPVLPQTIADLKIILIDDQDKTCEISFANTAFTSGADCSKEINLYDYRNSFANNYMVVDEPTLLSALAMITNGTNGAALPGMNTIKMLKDIRLETVFSPQVGGKGYVAPVDRNNPTPEERLSVGYYIGTLQTLFFNKNITIDSDFNAKLTIASGQSLNLRSLNSDAKFTVNVDLEIEGMGCCGGAVGKLFVGGAKNNDTKAAFGNIDNYGALVLGTITNSKAVITVDKLVNKYDAAAIEKAGKRTDAATLGIGGITNTNVTIGTLENGGNIWVRPLIADIAQGVANQFTTKPIADTFTGLSLPLPTTRIINVTIGTLTNEVTRPSTGFLGGSILVDQYSIVNVNTSMDNKSDESLIQIIGTSASATDGRLDAKGAAVNAGTIDNTGVVNFTGSNLDNNGLFIDQTSGQVGGKKVNNGTATGTTTKYYAGDQTKYYSTDLGVEGIYVSQVHTDARMAFVLSDAVEYPSTVIVEILNSDQAGGVYNLAKYANDLAGKDVYVRANKQIAFKAYLGTGTPTALSTKSFGHCVEVFNGTLLAKDGILSTVHDVKVNSGATFLTSASTAGYPDTFVTIGRDLINNGITTHTAKLLTVTEDLTNTGTFTSNATFDVKDTINTSGTFTSTGTDNTAGAFSETAGSATFAAQTTTTISGRFDCTGGSFERLGLGGGNSYRATVNVGTLGATTGTTTSGWPTEM